MSTEHGWYVYGIVESDVEVLPGNEGVGDPPAPVELIRSGEVAALVSRVDVDKPLGSRADLFAHRDVLDAAAGAVPVLPMRFGAVLSSRSAVVHELLEPHADEFTDALNQLEGEAQYVFHARYDESALVHEVLSENPDAMALVEQIRDEPIESTRDTRLQLGELLGTAVEAKRSADTDVVIEAVTPVVAAVSVRPPTHEEDAAHVAMLVDIDNSGELEDLLDSLARSWEGRANARLLGPMAPYDFVTTTQG